MKNLITRIFAKAPIPVEQDGTMMTVVRPEARARWMSTGLRKWTPQMIEDCFRGALAGDLVKQWELFDLMEETWPQLQKNLCELKDTVASLDWVVQPYTVNGDEPTPSALEKAQLVESLIWNMNPSPDRVEYGFEDTVWNILDARGKGISVLEIDWEIRVNDGKQAVCPRCTRYVNPIYYGFPPSGDDRLMLKGNMIDGYIETWVPFVKDKFLIGMCQAKSGHPISAAMLRVLAFWWAASNFSKDWFLNFAQLFGQPMRWATYDPNLSESDKNTLADMLANMGSAAWAMFPSGTQLELKEAAKGGADNPQMALLNFADKICDMVILRQTLTSDVGSSGSGSRALGEVHERVLTGVKQSLASWVCRVLNQQFVPAILNLNYGDRDECPTIIASIREQRDRKTTADGLFAARQAGVSIPMAWAHEQLDIPQPGPGDDVIEPIGSAQANPFMAGASGGQHVHVHASSATDKLVDNVLESLTGVEARWLGGVKPFFKRLLVAAEDPEISDDEFTRTIEAARKQIPGLFDKLDTKALQDAMESAMGAGAFNGAVRGYTKRGFGRK